MSTPVHWAIVHHTVTPSCFNQEDCSYWMRSIQDYHMDSNGWDDIGYSFLVGEDGNLYEGRGWDRVGAHTVGFNDRGIAFSMIGDFTSHLPNEAALATLAEGIACGVSLGKFTTDYGLFGHRQSPSASTACPGDTLYPYVTEMPHWVENPE